jgi:hypothetical protein
MGRHYLTTEEERAEARREYRKAYYARQREKLLAAREIARGLGCPERRRGRPRLSDEERLERRRERQRKYYERKVGHPVVHFTAEERKAKEFKANQLKRQAELTKGMKPLFQGSLDATKWLHNLGEYSKGGKTEMELQERQVDLLASIDETLSNGEVMFAGV